MESVSDMIADVCACDHVEGPGGTGDGVADIGDVANVGYYLIPSVPLFFVIGFFFLCICMRK